VEGGGTRGMDDGEEGDGHALPPKARIQRAFLLLIRSSRRTSGMGRHLLRQRDALDLALRWRAGSVRRWIDQIRRRRRCNPGWARRACPGFFLSFFCFFKFINRDGHV
jgi:hypothetical protein